MARVQQSGGPGDVIRDIAHADLVFAASGAMTWTVEAADLEVCRLTSIGRLNVLYVRILASSIGGVADVALLMTLPSNVVAVAAPSGSAPQCMGHLQFTGTVNESGGVIGLGGGGRLLVLRRGSSANFAASVNNQHVSGFCVWNSA